MSVRPSVSMTVKRMIIFSLVLLVHVGREAPEALGAPVVLSAALGAPGLALGTPGGWREALVALPVLSGERDALVALDGERAAPYDDFIDSEDAAPCRVYIVVPCFEDWVYSTYHDVIVGFSVTPTGTRSCNASVVFLLRSTSGLTTRRGRSATWASLSSWLCWGSRAACASAAGLQLLESTRARAPAAAILPDKLMSGSLPPASTRQGRWSRAMASWEFKTCTQFARRTRVVAVRAPHPRDGEPSGPSAASTPAGGPESGDGTERSRSRDRTAAPVPQRRAAPGSCSGVAGSSWRLQRGGAHARGAARRRAARINVRTGSVTACACRSHAPLARAARTGRRRSCAPFAKIRRDLPEVVLVQSRRRHELVRDGRCTNKRVPTA